MMSGGTSAEDTQYEISATEFGVCLSCGECECCVVSVFVLKLRVETLHTDDSDGGGPLGSEFYYMVLCARDV
jgi:hypothetical protein